MSLFEKYKKISKLKNKSTLSFNTVKLNRNSKHLLGINGKNHVAILFNASKPKGGTHGMYAISPGSVTALYHLL